MSEVLKSESFISLSKHLAPIIVQTRLPDGAIPARSCLTFPGSRSTGPNDRLAAGPTFREESPSTCTVRYIRFGRSELEISSTSRYG